ncbi:MAG: hypothetical protein HC924_14295 [Synechococcaceae cyanobacterium SM2_3_2]|nr:hypothetical protein [Synechococcaceae cyanobacterium SM2_3_2]
MIRSKLTQLDPGVVMASPSPRVRVIWHHNQGGEHVIAYPGFDSAEAADICHRWLLAKVGKFDRKANAGVNRPRRAQRVDGCTHEIKWHQPHSGILAQAIERDLARVTVNA